MTEETHSNWLERMEQDSREKQQGFMNDIARRLKRPRITEAPAPFSRRTAVLAAIQVESGGKD